MTITEKIEKLVAEAQWCGKCEQDFESDADKYAPNYEEVRFTGTGQVICGLCAEAEWDGYYG